MIIQSLCALQLSILDPFPPGFLLVPLIKAPFSSALLLTSPRCSQGRESQAGQARYFSESFLKKENLSFFHLSLSGEVGVNGERWVLGEAGKDLLDD